MLPHVLPEIAILDLPEDQYYFLLTISSYLSPNDGDLAQLPFITGQPVFRSMIWTLFYPLFVTTSQRQQSDSRFYQILQKVQIGNISAETWQILSQKHSEFLSRSAIDTLLNTTNIVSFRENAQQIN
ncbi:3595_t:CDS:2 [Funneliformis geosporum]|uniref:3595_t:CDS:1 n=1 Tax=Funneliformis geosporum TaxID=1117311 RepID=A0A9W4SHF7_9GLOM|nr:3595_t:CDS:2 [Funneliformis geosporum]